MQIWGATGGLGGEMKKKPAKNFKSTAELRRTLKSLVQDEKITEEQKAELV